MNYGSYPNYFQFGQNLPIQKTQSDGLVSVRSEQEARNYPVGYGNSVTFKDETAPYIYTKTMGFSQLDRPVFERFKLVKEDANEAVMQPNVTQGSIYTDSELKSKFDEIWKELNSLKEKLSYEYEPA